MKRGIVFFVHILLCLLMAELSFASLNSVSRIDEDHISNDLDRKMIQDWPFKKKGPHRIKIRDVKYDEDRATLSVLVKVLSLSGEVGRKGEIHLVYESAGDDWNLLEITPVTFSVMNAEDNRIMFEINKFPLLVAVDEGDITSLKSLIADGADVNVESDDCQTRRRGWSPLRLAAERGNLDIIKILVDNGADVNDSNYHDDDTALLRACSRGHTAIAQFLISKGANVNYRNALGYTPLMAAAVWAENVPITKALLNNGADVNVRNTDKKTALALAKPTHNKEIVRLLKKAEGKK